MFLATESEFLATRPKCPIFFDVLSQDLQNGLHKSGQLRFEQAPLCGELFCERDGSLTQFSNSIPWSDIRVWAYICTCISRTV